MRLSTWSALLALAATAHAQCPPATYTSYGAGCAGSGSGASPCLSANWGNPFSGNIGVRSFALLVNSGANPLVICSVDFFTATVSGTPAMTNVYIYDRPTAGGPPGTQLGAGTMAVSGTPGPCRATFTPPVLILPGTDFFLGLDNSINMRLPIMTTGTRVVHYHSGPPNWSGPFTSVNWNYQINCCTATATPTLSATGTPQIGGSYTANLTQARAMTIALLFTGFSNSNWLGIPLPLDLTGAGAPGCSLLAPGTFITVSTTDATGNASQPTGIPSDPTLCQGTIFQQWIVVDAPANAFGFAFSNGGAGVIGS